MTKKSKTQPDQVTPETEWPETGGSYVRDAMTGSLTQQPIQTTSAAGDVLPADTKSQNKQSEE